mgnify:CR=1 FL=1
MSDDKKVEDRHLALIGGGITAGAFITVMVKLDYTFFAYNLAEFFLLMISAPLLFFGGLSSLKKDFEFSEKKIVMVLTAISVVGIIAFAMFL